MASIGDTPFYSTSPIPLQTGLGYREQALKNQGQETLNQGYEMNNEYKVQQTREATRLNDEAQRQLDKSADLRAAYAQSTTHQPIGHTQPVAQPQQPPIGTSTAQQSSAQSIGGLNFGQNLPNLNTPISQLIGQKPAQPAPGAGASPYGTTGPLKQTQVVPTLAEQTGIAPLVAAHPSANSTLDQGAVGRGEHSAFQTFTQPVANYSGTYALPTVFANTSNTSATWTNGGNNVYLGLVYPVGQIIHYPIQGFMVNYPGDIAPLSVDTIPIYGTNHSWLSVAVGATTNLVWNGGASQMSLLVRWD